VIPDTEAILGSYLREHDAVKALGARVVPRTPSDTSAPWVKVTQLDAQAVGGHRSDHLIQWLGQFDCYAGSGGQKEASAVTRTVRAALGELHDTDPEGVTVSGVRFVSCPRLPDGDDFEPARERYVLSAIVWMHP
jgi:hypothetical protein